ncbi:MAG: hypothetical protein ACD_49C00070G0009 [uncultured bacterium (gcode 4)]|uniref:Uncharacterized protein n=1 Tax=uncultured bacterium (gcode 4) TaxID=1234023 RepID=K2AD64_9BACT|nr:MAG: hypothetical protein ACD_49C00070G0009 [uncultured bacterium (gcode 4)]
MLFSKIVEDPKILTYLNERNLLKQYKKAKTFLLLWLYANVDFWLREPKKDEIYYFRINKQFRAYCIIEKQELRIYKIDNHQN